MAIQAVRRAYLRGLGLPSDVETIRRVRAFAIQSGLTYQEVADLAGMNYNTLRVYVCGSYGNLVNGQESNTLNIRARLKETLDKYELRNTPPAAGRHYSTQEYEAIRESMWSALRNGTAFQVDGPPGTQKTYSFRRVVDEINASGEGRAIYIYASVDQSPYSFLVETCSEAGIPNRGTTDQLVRKLRFFLGGQRALLIVDEAQHLGINGLEILRQLLDTPPYFGVGIGGSHDLTARLRSWQMEQWRSRLRRTHMLNGLLADEAAFILQAELGRMSKQDIDDSISDATTTAKRGVPAKEFTYISARNLFFAINDARAALESSSPEPSAMEAIA